MRPHFSAKTPTEDFGQRAKEQRQFHSGRARRRSTDGVFSLNGADRRPKHIICALRALIERRDDDTDKRNRWGQRIADGRVAAVRIPAIKAFWRQPQSLDAILPFHEGKRGRSDLDDVRAAVGVEQVGAAEPVDECLAISAIADHANDLPRRGVRYDAAHFSTTATKLRPRAHLVPSLYIAAGRSPRGIAQCPKAFAKIRGDELPLII